MYSVFLPRKIYILCVSKYFSSQSSWARGELIREPWGGGAVSGNTTEHKRLNETQIREKRKAQRRRTAKQRETERNSDPIVAYIRYISPSDVVHPKINNLTYISRQGYQITEFIQPTKFIIKAYCAIFDIGDFSYFRIAVKLPKY